MTYLSSQEKRMFVTWAEWPKYRLCFACEEIRWSYKEVMNVKKGPTGQKSTIICIRFALRVIYSHVSSHTNFSEHGKSKSLMRPKSSPVTRLRPAWETHAQLTSAFSALRGQTPRTSSPRMLEHRTRHFSKLPFTGFRLQFPLGLCPLLWTSQV